MPDINFLTQRRAIFGKANKQDALYRRYATIAFEIILSLFVLAAAANIFLTIRLRQTNDKQIALTAQISSDEPVETSFLIFAQKLKSIKEIYENRSNKQQAIDFFSNIFGDQVFLSGMNYGGESNQLSLRLTSKDIFAFENTLNILNSDEIKNVFSSVTQSGLRRDDIGNYSLDIAVELTKEGEK